MTSRCLQSWLYQQKGLSGYVHCEQANKSVARRPPQRSCQIHRCVSDTEQTVPTHGSHWRKDSGRLLRC